MSLKVPLIYKNQLQFGFDIGTTTVKIVQLKGGRAKPKVQAYGYCPFPREVIAEGVIVNADKMADTLKPFLNKLPYGHLTARQVVTGLPASKIFTRTLQLPQMSEADLSQAVQYEVEQYVPVPIAELYVDYEIIHAAQAPAPVPAKKTKANQPPAPAIEPHMIVLMVAAPRTIVDSYLKLFEKLGLSVGGVEGNMSAVVRALVHSGDAPSHSLVMDIGSISTDMAIYEGYTPLTGSIAIGGESYTDALVKNLKVKPQQAAEIKMKFGLAKGDMHLKVFSAMEPQLQTVAKEARRLVKFFEERGVTEHKIDALVVSGGTASMPGFPEYLQAETRLPMRVANPWKNVQVKQLEKATAPMYTTAIGLALRGLND